MNGWQRWSVLALLVFCQRIEAQGRDPFEEVRFQMVSDHIASEGVTNPRVLQSMRTVPRHLFVRPNLRSQAYLDQALDIGFKQTISPPYIVAYMTDMLDPQPDDRVLEIGTGSGYQAAVLSSLVKDVYTIEIVEPLGKRTTDLLKRLKYENIHCRIGDGYQGWPEEAPFDKIIVTCSPESVPQPLIDQLKEGGRMIIPLGERYQQVFHLLEKKDGELKQTRLVPTLFVPMTGKMEEIRAVLPNPAAPRIVNGDFELDENGDGQADGWHYQRRSTLVSEGAPQGKTYIRFENSEPGRNAHMLQGLPLDGSKVSALNLRWTMKSESIVPGSGSSEEVPFIALHLFDGQRLPIGRLLVGPFTMNQSDWKAGSTVLAIPKNCREAIIQVGLNGATGSISFDSISISSQ